VRVHYAKEPKEVLVELLHNHALGSKFRETVSKAKGTAVTWVCLEDYLQDQRSRADNLLSQTLKTATSWQ
jgi:hypothetical protein